MFSRRLVSLLLVSLSACAVGVGCAATDASEDDNVVEGGDGDGDRPADELVAERQLNGSELPEKTISLTFDDGPGRRTGELADFLGENGVKAAFFINGMQVGGRQAALDKVVGRGHLLANHTQNHKQLTGLNAAKIISEVEQTDEIIASLQPNGPWVIRAPFGAWNGNVARTLNGSPMKKYVGSVFWDEGGALTNSAAADWDCWGKGVSVQQCGQLYLQEIRSKKRGVVLMHDIHEKTVDMVKQILPTLIAEGYKFIPVHEVPSVDRAIRAAAGGGGGTAPTNEQQCPSSTLGRAVDENICVQSRTDQKWYRCVHGEWAASAGAGDSRCTQRFGL
jgi:peptidoglycan-N-acetylglucosamine deacetylase